jgi:hypothetical protein
MKFPFRQCGERRGSQIKSSTAVPELLTYFPRTGGIPRPRILSKIMEISMESN